MTPKNDLFLLVKSLSKSERGYFKKFCNVYSDNKESIYVELFDCIEGMEEYDERIIHTKFKGSKILVQLHVRKNYLFKLILKSLRSYYNNDTVETEINNLMHEGSILREKGLFDLAYEVFSKARSKAKQYELSAKQIDVNSKILEIIDYVNNKVISNNEYDRESFDLSKKITMLEEVRELRLRMAVLYKRVMTDKNVKGIRAEAQRIVEQKFLKDVALLKKSPLILEGYYRILSFNAIISGNYKLEYEYKQKYMELLESNTNLGIDRPGNFLSALASICAAQASLQKADELKMTVNKMLNLKNDPRFSSVYLKSKIFEHTTVFMGVYLSFGSTSKEFLAFVKMVDNEFPKHENFLLPYNHGFICYNMAIVLFYAGYFRDSLKWVNKILFKEKGKLPIEIVNVSQLLKLMIRYEQEDFDFVEQEAKSLIKYFESQRHISTELHLLVINYFLNYFLKSESEKKKGNFYRELNHKITALLNTSSERISNNYFRNICVWLESKISGVPVILLD